jgi:hypothetical protein
VFRSQGLNVVTGSFADIELLEKLSSEADIVIATVCVLIVKFHDAYRC